MDRYWLVYGVARLLGYAFLWFVVSRGSWETFETWFVLFAILRFECEDVLRIMKRRERQHGAW